jgi:hypothetical protein
MANKRVSAVLFLGIPKAGSMQSLEIRIVSHREQGFVVLRYEC